MNSFKKKRREREREKKRNEEEAHTVDRAQRSNEKVDCMDGTHACVIVIGEKSAQAPLAVSADYNRPRTKTGSVISVRCIGAHTYPDTTRSTSSYVYVNDDTVQPLSPIGR